MCTQHIFGGLFKYKLCLTIILCHSASHASHGSDFSDESVHAQGKVSLDVDLLKEFDKTVSEVKILLNVTDKKLQEKLNRTIYNGLLNHMIKHSGNKAEFQVDIPEADDKIVNNLENAGFVALANLAGKDDGVSKEKGDLGQPSKQQVTSCSKSSISLQGHDVSCKKQTSHVVGESHRSLYTSSLTCCSSCRSETQGKSDGVKSTLLDPKLGELSSPQKPRNNSNSSKDNSSNGSQHKNTILNGRISSEYTSKDFPAISKDDRKRLVNTEGLPIIEEDLYWSAEIEAASPKGFSQRELDEWKDRLSEQSVRTMEPGDTDKCGRGKNRFITLQDGSRLCARYRYPLVTSMTGELYSYHLARMLGLTNLPPLHLSVATTKDSFWRGLESDFDAAEWEDGKVVFLTKWIEDLGSAFFPDVFTYGPFPVGSQSKELGDLTTKELVMLLQWSDLLVFDYLIAHFDRLTINLAGVRYYNDTSLMKTQVHNLVQHPQTGQLWIVDNESGLLDGYSFLMVERNDDSLLQGLLHEELLHKNCIFRRSTVERVGALLQHPNPARILAERVLREDPSSEGVFPSLDQTQRHAGVLKERLVNIKTWMQECQRSNAAAENGSQ